MDEKLTSRCDELTDLCWRIIRDAVPATDYGQTYFVPKCYLEKLATYLSQIGPMVEAREVFRIAGGDVECEPTPSAESALACLRGLRQCYDEHGNEIATSERNRLSEHGGGGESIMCEVAVAPATRFSPGVALSTVVEAIRSRRGTERYTFNAKMDRITAPPPAPAANGEIVMKVLVPSYVNADDANRLYGEAYGVDWEYAPAAEQGDIPGLGCADCGLSYGSERWADFVVPDDAWLKISPTGHEGGVLCVQCMIDRATRAGIECIGQFTSGPFADTTWRKPEARGVEGCHASEDGTHSEMEESPGWCEWCSEQIAATPNPVRAEQPEGKGEDALIALFNEVYEREWDRAADEADDRAKAIMGPADEHATRMAIRAVLATAPAAPVGVAERVRGIIALLRQPEPDNGEKRTEHDEGYEQASSEIADMLERILSGVSAPVGVEAPRLSDTEFSALDGLQNNLEHEAGDVYDSAPGIDDDEDAYWAYHSWHAIKKLRAAALTPAATYATPDDVALNMGPDDVPRLLIAGAQVARFPKGSWTEVCKAFDFGGYRNEQPAATPRGEESAPVVQMNNAPQIVPAASEDGLPERLEAEAARRESVWTDQPVMSPPTRFKHPTPLRNLLTEAAALIRRLAASGQGVEGWTIQVKCGGPDDERGIWAVDSEGSSIWLAAAPTQEKGNG